MGLGGLPDEMELLQRLKAGDELAFAILYNRYKGLLYVHAYRELKSREEVKDIIHDIFLSLWEKRANLDITESLSSYLYKAVRFKVINKINRRQHSNAYIAHFQKCLDGYLDNTDYLVREKLLSSIIESEIAHLPPKMKQVFELSRNENLTHREIAERLNITEQSVRSHVKNALHVLRLKLGLFLIMAFLVHGK